MAKVYFRFIRYLAQSLIGMAMAGAGFLFTWYWKI